ncbi:MAG: UDP-N-acetylglucosamine--N-acetylmuramyl-(pentapeptide) pyrophosphoryl-undecaprenol N-acetylglucosamine transferase [Patescibacteria group bacterium]
MKIVFTGGGTGGHFYPIIAVAEKVNKIIDDEKIADAKLYYISDDPYDKEVLQENGLIFEEVKSGKIRVGFSLKNFTDIFKMFFGFLNALYKLFSIYPDVIFGKGGYASFPTVLAARVLRIPVIIHESDSVPGRVNEWAGKFAKKIAVSFKEAAEYFPAKKVAWTGHPIRAEIEHKSPQAIALEHFKLESQLPVILVLGGSQGSELINNAVLDSLPRLVKNFQIIHQTGIKNFQNVTSRSQVILTSSQEKVRYLPFPFLNPLNMTMAAGAASLIVSRAGSALFEIASWGIPSIIIPITSSHGDHQRKNAFTYAYLGACNVIEEANMTANILSSEIERILNNKNIWDKMTQNTRSYNKPDAAYKIAHELVDIALSHEK